MIMSELTRVILSWLVMFVGYGVAIYFIAKTFLMARSMQPGEVPYVPALGKWIKKAMAMLNVQESDRVVDIGSGDGVVINRMALMFRSADFTGIEFRKHLVKWSNMHRLFFWNRNARFIHADVFTQDLSEYNKVYLYMTRSFLEGLMPKLEEELPRGAVVVSLAFGFGDKFERKYHGKYEVEDMGKGKNDKIYRWIKE